MRRIILILCAIVPLIATTACKRDADKAGPAVAGELATPQAEPVADATFKQAQQAWRDERKANLTKPDGWASLIGLHWIEPGPHYIGSDADNGIRLAMGPEHMGLLERKGDQVRLVPDKSAVLVLDGEPFKSATILKSDADEGGPAVIGFDEGKGLATVIKRGDRYALRVKHADAPTRTAFAGLDYWPADPAWKITGSFVPHPAGKTIQIANIIGSLDDIPNPGAVEFKHAGQTYRLEALDEGDDELFLIYADRTSGHESYGAGRYLYASRPDAQNQVVLDFNHGYNPPCAFTAFATCPLPPPENRLDVAITAGEKAYAKPH